MNALTYEEVIEYLAERAGESVTLSSHPTFGSSTEGGGPTLLGLTIGLTLGAIEGVEPHENQWLDGRAGIRIKLCDESGKSGSQDGLVLTREWFGGAFLDENRSNLRVFVRVDIGAEPFYPPLGQEPNDDDDEPEDEEVFLHDLIGWGFTFDFDGSAPISGRWADARQES